MAGVAIGCLVGGALIAVLVTWLLLRKRYRHRAQMEKEKEGWVMELVKETEQSRPSASH